MPSHLCANALWPIYRLEAGILQEIREREESHAEMSAGIKGRMAAAVAAIEELAESSITGRFEPGMHQHVSHISNLRTRAVTYSARGGIVCGGGWLACRGLTDRGEATDLGADGYAMGFCMVH